MVATSELAYHISKLGPREFVELCSALVLSVADRDGIKLEGLSWNLNVFEKDGGVDARFLGATTTVPRLIPSSKVFYQCKSGEKAGSAAEIAKSDILEKGTIKQALQDGHHFVYFAGRDRAERIETDIAKALDTAGLSISEEQIHYLGSACLAGLLQSFPGLIYRFLRLQHDCDAFEAWSASRTMANPFVNDSDPSFQSKLDVLASGVARERAWIELYGAAGNGKTRLALEAIRSAGNGLSSHTVYTDRADQAEKFLRDLTRFESPRAVLVADDLECSEMARLRNLHPSLKGNISVLAIGLDTSMQESTGVYNIPSLSEKTLVDIIQQAVAGVSAADAGSLARLCEGSPKLAVLLAELLKENPGLLHGEFSTKSRAATAIESLLDESWGKNEIKALKALSMFSRVGWDGEYESEAEFLFEQLGLEFSESRDAIESIHRSHGIVPSGGRYKYVSPAILADYLAVTLMESLSQNQFRKLIQELPPELMNSLTARLRRIGKSLRHKDVIKEVLGPDGPFKSLDDISGGAEKLLTNLAQTFPGAVLQLLTRLTDAISLDALRTHRQSRRTLVWCLENALWLEATFPEAARLLLRLAMAENETWGNNATAIWLETFQSILGRTVASPARRLSVLKTLYDGHVDEDAHLLIIQALGRALRSSNLGRMGVPPDTLPGSPVEAWKPKNREELLAAFNLYVDFLSDILMSGEMTENVAKTAAAALVEADDIIALGDEGLMVKWFDTARRLCTASFPSKKVLLTRIDHYLWRETESMNTLPQGVIEKLANLKQELIGDSWLEQLKTLLNQPEWELDEKVFLPELRPFLSKVISDPGFLKRELAFLDGASSYRRVRLMFEELARMDNEVKLLRPLLTAGGVSRMAAGYLLDYLMAHPDPTVSEEVFKALETVEQPEARQRLEFSLLAGLDYHPDRFEKLLELIAIDPNPEHIGTLRFSRWIRDLEDKDLSRLLDRIGPGRVSLELLNDYLYDRDSVPSVLSPFLRTMLDSFEPKDDSEEFRWVRIAEKIVEDEPDAVLTSFLRKTPEARFYSASFRNEKSHTEKLICRAWKQSGKTHLLNNVIQKLLEADPLVEHVTMKRLKFFFPDDDDADLLIQWVQEQPKLRAPAAAAMAGKPQAELTKLQRQLISRFAEDACGTLFGNLIEGSWTGSAAAHWSGKLERVSAWEKDQDPAVAEWGRSVRSQLEAWRDVDLQREEERKLDWR